MRPTLLRAVPVRRPSRGLLAVAALAVGLMVPDVAVSQATPPRALLERVLPGATRFSEREGTPPVIRGWAREGGAERLVGYAFLTSDAPPEELGYSGPIEVLVGMDPKGVITGVVVMDYNESLMSSRGDFLGRRGFQEQFAGKGIGDAFRVRRDIDGISGATITVGAMSRGVRNAARRVWAAHISDAADDDVAPPHTPDAAEIRALSWLDMNARGMTQRLTVLDNGLSRIEITLLRVLDDEAGKALLGEKAFADALEKGGEHARGRHLWMVGVDGALTALFRPQALYVVQDDDTVRFESRDAALLGEPRGGKANAQFRNAGLLFMDPSKDMDRPFTFLFDLNNGMGAFTVRYPGKPPAVVARATATRRDDATGESAGAGASGDRGAGADGGPRADTAASGTGAADGGTPRPGAPGETAPGRDPAGGQAPDPDASADRASDAATAGSDGGAPSERQLADALGSEADGSVLARTLAQTSWGRFAALAALLGLVTAALVLKERTALRAAALGVTLLFLGFGGGGFLSVSHLLAAVKVGPGVFLEDLVLLLLVGYTAVTTLLFGRVFCGYLCPFGALQDLLDRVVPARFKRELPRAVHEKALLAKYGVLALVLLPALAGSQAVLFQYVEPFGTVFFLSSSAVLWSIAAGILLASAVVPRFYCRYACPLGASLALASLAAPFRIRRVEQCTVCTVCERLCPTGAIDGADVDFKECVRCNRCEVALERRVGVCRHDMDEVRRRLVQIEIGPRRETVRGG